MEVTTAQAVEFVLNSYQYDGLLACLGLIAAILTFIWFSLFYNR